MDSYGAFTRYGNDIPLVNWYLPVCCVLVRLLS